jgi:hypothetical protein
MLCACNGIVPCVPRADKESGCRAPARRLWSASELRSLEAHGQDRGWDNLANARHASPEPADLRSRRACSP